MSAKIDERSASFADFLFERGRQERRAGHAPPTPPVSPTERPAPIPDDETPRPISDPQAYARSALDGACNDVRNAPEGARNHTLNAAAYSLGRLVGAELLDEATATEALQTAADEAGLDPSEIPGTIASGLYAGLARPTAWVHAPAEHVALARPFEPDSQHDLALKVTSDDQLYENELRLQRARRKASRHLDEEESSKQVVAVDDGWRLDELLARPEEPEGWLIDQVLPPGANVTLTAPFKTGKTTFMANLLASLADLTPLCDRWDVIGDPGNVALWDFEMTQRQLRKWLAEVGVTHSERVHGLDLRGAAMRLSTDEGMRAAVAWLARRQIGVWIIDPFARAFKADENDNAAVTDWTDRLDIIKAQAGVHTLVMPLHTGRREGDDMRARGATRLDDWPDVRWLLRKDDTDRRMFKATGRDVDTDEFLLRYDVMTRRYTASDRPAHVDTVNELGQRLFDALPWYEPGTPGMTASAAWEAIGQTKRGGAGALDSAMDWLRLHKALECELRTGGSRWQLWKRRV